MESKGSIFCCGNRKAFLKATEELENLETDHCSLPCLNTDFNQTQQKSSKFKNVQRHEKVLIHKHKNQTTMALDLKIPAGEKKMVEISEEKRSFFES
ncbi:hypothetical protein AAHA92_25878 [Salvia divinorum]|uniref:Uncharacterized protein n=1 Tax=Salvia divinorum TaxID=28513 RepID=A0ABD1GF71_SALDI